MADERASVTLTLTDEMSDGLRTITQHFEELQKSMGETQKTGNDAFRSMRDELKKLNEAYDKHNKDSSKGHEDTKNSMASVMAALGNLGGKWSELGRQMAAASVGSKALGVEFASLVGLVGRFTFSVPGMVTALGTFTVAAARAAETAKNLRQNLGESTEAGVANIRRLFEEIGERAEDADQALEGFSKQFHSLALGINSSFRQMLESHGMERLADQLEDLERRGGDASQGLEVFLKRLRNENDTLVRQVAESMGRTYSEYRNAADKIGSLRKPWTLPREEADQLLQWQLRNIQLTREWTDAVQDLANQGWARLAQVTTPMMNDFITDLNVILAITKSITKSIQDWADTHLPDWLLGKNLNQGRQAVPWTGPTLGPLAPGGEPGADVTVPGTGGKTIKDFYREELERQRKIQEETRGVETGQQPRGGGGGGGIFDMMIPGRQAGGPTYAGRPYMVGERGPELFVPHASGNVINQAAGGVGFAFQRLQTVEEQSSDYLREMRDVLDWMKQQMEGKPKTDSATGGDLADQLGIKSIGGSSSGGGTGPGGGYSDSGISLGSYAGGGGGRRTGAPWFGGAGGRGGAGGYQAAGGVGDIPLVEGDITGTGRGHGGRFNAPAGAPMSGERKTITLANGQQVTVNARAAEQFQGFFNDLIAAGAPVRNLGGYGHRGGNPSQHPPGLAIDWAQHSRNVVDRDVMAWIRGNQNTLNQLEQKWGMSGGEHWGSPDTGHFSIDTLFGTKHLEMLRSGNQPQGAPGGFGGGQGYGQAGMVPGMPGTQGGNALAASRARFMSELSNPQVLARMSALTSAEVGSQGQQAQVALMETIFNRASARGQSLMRTMQRDYYEPMRTGAFERHLARGGLPGFENLLQGVLGGSNVANLATGNASGNVGVGQLTARYGGERFGVEAQNADRRWAAMMAQALRSGTGGMIAQSYGMGQQGGGMQALVQAIRSGGIDPAALFGQHGRNGAMLNLGRGGATFSFADPTAAYNLARDQLQRGPHIGGEFEPRDTSGLPLHPRAGGEPSRLRGGARTTQKEAEEHDRRDAREAAGIGLAGDPKRPADVVRERHQKAADKDLAEQRRIHERTGEGGGPGIGLTRTPSHVQHETKITKDREAALWHVTKHRPDPNAGKTDEQLQKELEDAQREFRIKHGVATPEDLRAARPIIPLSPEALRDPKRRRAEEHERRLQRDIEEGRADLDTRLRAAEREGVTAGEKGLTSATRWGNRLRARRREEREQESVDRDAVDKSIAGKTNQHIGTAQVDVKFHNVPKGTRTSATADGAFKKVNLEKTPANPQTGNDAAAGNTNQEE